MDLLPTFLQTISAKQLINPPQKVLVAVSGGLDSMVLCDLCKRAALHFTIVHCNFKLRGEESDRDEAFVRDAGAGYKLKVLIQQFDTETFAAANRLSIQEAARDLRYKWFEEVRKKEGYAYTLLAHHADDNAETVMMNFFRGTGLEGLTGMPAHNRDAANCIRPLLAVRRKEIEAYAKENNLQWIEDSSNRSNKYTRNFFRNELLPQVEKVFPQATENVLNTIKRLGQTALLYKELIAGLKKKVCEIKGAEVHIPVLKLMKYKDTSLVYEIISDYGFGEAAVAEVLKLADSESGKYIANKDYRLIRHRQWFIISPTAVIGNTVMIEKEDGKTRYSEGVIAIKKINKEQFRLDPAPSVAQIDASQIDFPLILRPWKAGDYFYPLGMRKKKKLARFFIDLKLSKSDKEKAWVIESNKKIIWIVGYRIDDRFKVSDTTRQIVLITVKR